MDKLVEHLSNRRVWAAIVSVLSFLLGAMKVKYNVDVPVLTDLLTAFGGGLSATLTAGLALHSYNNPKP